MNHQTFPFGFEVSASGEADAQWLSEKFETQVLSARLRDFDKMGGMSGDFFLLDVVLVEKDGEKQKNKEMSLALKLTGAEMQTAKTLGTPREALFYAELAPELTSAGLAKAWYAHGDLSTGEKLIFMECFKDAVPCGTFFGASNPNNWGLSSDKLAEMSEGNPNMKETSAHAFRLYAAMHARFWKDPSLLGKHWLKGSDWMQGKAKTSWLDAQKMASEAWAEEKALLEKKEPRIEWDPHVVACLDQSFSLVSWQEFQAQLTTTHWTLVHGDCHPHNALWINQRTEDATMALIDFEMVAIGSAAQELGQYLISHMPPDERRASEHDLVHIYHTELCANLQKRGLNSEAQGFSFDACWAEYVMGGAGRWLWMVPYLVKVCPAKMGQYFHDQLSAFLHDHLPTVEQIKMPRA